MRNSTVPAPDDPYEAVTNSDIVVSQSFDHGRTWSDPVARLGELLEMHGLYFGKSPESERVEIRGEVLQQLAALLSQAGYLSADKPFAVAFNEFIGNENFEERADPEARWIDRPVLDYLLRKLEN